MKEPDVNCEYCGGDGTISHTGYDDFDLYAHFGSMTCECVKEYDEEESV